MLISMALALFATGPAGSRARFKHLPEELLVRSGAARRHIGGGHADIRAVEIEPYTLS